MVGGTNKGCNKDMDIGVASEGMRNENRGGIQEYLSF